MGLDFGNTPDKLTYLTRKRLYLTVLDSPHSEGVMKTCTEIVLIFEDEGSLMSPTSIKIYLTLYKLGGSIIDDADSSGQDAAE